MYKIEILVEISDVTINLSSHILIKMSLNNIRFISQ